MAQTEGKEKHQLPEHIDIEQGVQQSDMQERMSEAPPPGATLADARQCERHDARDTKKRKGHDSYADNQRRNLSMFATLHRLRS